MTERLRARVAKSLRLEHPWRPRHGDTGVLRTRPDAAGAELGGAVLHALERRLQEALRLEERGAVDVDGVHDRRVALRRLRAALELAGARGHARRVHALYHALGRVRDLQLRPEGPPGQAEERRAELDERAREWLADAAPRLAGRVRRLVVLGVAASTVRARLEQDVRKLVRALEALDPALAPERVHRARLATKRVRDDLEAAGLDRSGLLPRLVALQEALGALHDHDEREAAASAARLDLVEPARRALRGLPEAVRALQAELRGDLQRLDR